MDDDREVNAESEPQGDDSVAKTPAPRWGTLWQVPTIILSVALIASGFALMISTRPGPSVDALLDRVDRLIDTGEAQPMEQAREMLEGTLRVRMNDAEVSDAQRARFYATRADWRLLSGQVVQNLDITARRRAVEDYARAVSLGGLLSPARIERWAEALIDLGDGIAARSRLAELEGLLVSSPGEQIIRSRRNRILRRLVEHSLAQPSEPVEEMLELLANYRRDSLLDPKDEAWAVAQQAEIRLALGDTSAAVDHLLIDMRRIEQRAAAAGSEVGFGPLHVLLGRAYFESGEIEEAQFALERAEALFIGPEPRRGDALLLLGEIDAIHNRLDDATLRMDEVVRDYQETPSYLPALLRRAELRSVLGEHEGALEDYARLREHLHAGRGDRHVNIDAVGQSLFDRQAGALAQRHVALALRYAEMARSLYTESNTPADTWFMVAVTHRARAEQLTNEGLARLQRTGGSLVELDPESRFTINEHYRQAAEAFVAHARAMTSSPDGGEAWADSLWHAADCFDLAGRTDQAVAHFHEYLANRSQADPRWAESMFRLAQAYHALMEYDEAAEGYERLIEEHPESQFATRSHVPLARTYVTLSRRPEAVRQLRDVLAGMHPITPEATDYRDALIELGKIHYESGEFVPAIERLDEALRRYPDDRRAPALVFRLGDAYRLEAARLQEEASQASLAPAEIDRLEATRRDHLREALRLMNEACDLLAEVPDSSKQRLERNMERMAWLYRADCAFELADYETAVQLYDIAARRYADHHASLNALIQMYNCYVALDDPERARAANALARSRLDQLPDEAFTAPDALMDRAAWERWLANSPLVSGGGS